MCCWACCATPARRSAWWRWAASSSRACRQGRTYHLMRVRLEEGTPLVPEISGHRLMVLVRLMQPDAEGRLRPSAGDTEFELTLCA